VVGWAATAAHPLLTPARDSQLRAAAADYRWMSLEATLLRVSAITQALADPAALVGSGGLATGGTRAPAQGAGASGSAFAEELQRASGGEEPPSASSAATAGELLDDPAAAALDAGASTGVGAASAGVGAYYPASLEGGAASAYSPAGLEGLAGTAALSPAGVAGAGEADATGARIVAIAESQLGQSEQPPGSNESPAIAMYRGATAGAVPGAPWCSYFASWVARQAGDPIGEGGAGAGAVSEVWSWAQRAGRAIANGPGVVPKPGDLIVFGDEHVGIVRDVLANGQIQTIEGNYENKVAANVRSPTEATGYVEMS